jgi:hypothetical protein
MHVCLMLYFDMVNMYEQYVCMMYVCLNNLFFYPVPRKNLSHSFFYAKINNSSEDNSAVRFKKQKLFFYVGVYFLALRRTAKKQ